MRFFIPTPSDKWQWHRWYAWYPVKVNEREYRWLEYVLRRRNGERFSGIYWWTYKINPPDLRNI